MSQFKVYRLRGIPTHLDRLGTVKLLVDILGDIDAADIELASLAQTKHSTQPASKTATLSFRKTPACIANSSSQNEWNFRVHALPDPLVLDDHFLGMTKLYDVEEDKCQCSIVAVSGLASHPFGSWQPSDDKSFMWLRDKLPHHMPEARVFTYGYDTVLKGSTSFQSMTDLATGFIAHLQASVWTTPEPKPVLLIAHSMGGILIKEAIAQLANTQRLGRIRGGIFFGVPSGGMEVSQLLSMVEGQPNKELVKFLSVESKELQKLDKVFFGVSSSWGIDSFWAYETKTSATVVRGGDGNFSRNGPQCILVSKESATRNLYGQDQSHIFPINKDHRGMVKFSRGDSEYDIILGKLKEILDKSVPGVARSEQEDPIQQINSGQQTEDLQWQTDHPEDTPQHAPRSYQTTFSLEDILKSLSYHGMDSRYGTIEKNMKHTFEWLYDDQVCPQFSQWLQSEETLFWIHGKPGSGKSTLMKYIWDDNRKWNFLHQWNRRGPEIRASFFFHHRGSGLQKSFEGFLRSLLHQILSQILEQKSSLEELIRSVFAKVIQGKPRPWTWTLRQLEEALILILEQTEEKLDMFLFFDALDEYDGPPDFIGKFVGDIAAMPTPFTRIKICFSSRPWGAFTRRFGERPSLQIHDFTHNDIRMYCETTFGTLDPDVRAGVRPLIPTIMARAQGVFLWVSLAIKDLCRHATGGTVGDELVRVLEGIPADLDAYYTIIIGRIEPSSRWDAYVILELLSLDSFSMPDILAILACSSSETLLEGHARIQQFLERFHCKLPIIPYKHEESRIDGLIDYDRTTRRLLREEMDRVRDRCGGLIDWNFSPRGTQKGSWRPVTIFDSSVQFIHQTVKEFVQKEGFRDLVLGPRWRHIQENRFSFLAKASMLWPVSPGYDAWHLAERTTGMGLKRFIDSVCENSGQEPQIIFLPREMDGGFKPTHVWSRGTLRARSRPGFDALALSAHQCLILYFKSTLDSDPAAVRLSKSPHLLLYALENYKSIARPVQVMEMCQILIDSGVQVPADDTSHITLAVGRTVVANPFGVHYEKAVELATYLIRRLDCLESDIESPPWVYEKKSVGKPLHFASASLTRNLLNAGAKVNSLDSLGTTPLDATLIRFGDKDAYMPDEFKKVMLLLEYGGLTKLATKRQCQKFARACRDEGCDPSLLEEYIRTHTSWPGLGKRILYSLGLKPRERRLPNPATEKPSISSTTEKASG